VDRHQRDADGLQPQHLLYHYCIVRSDLPIGLIGAYLIHASDESVTGPVPPGTNAVALAVPDEAALTALRHALAAAGIAHAAIVETEGAHAGHLMAVGCAPAPKARLKRHLSSYPKLKEKL
jgi:hypothetical protein